MMSNVRQYVIGTAGHIDHGKTALVQALTGINTDRLKEEQERGITVNLGFAHFSDNVTIIDVPGHERLIKNMVAGVSTIDLVLFVVAADDGIMPQTREHLDIIKLLDIRRGIFVITKTDLVDTEWLMLVEEELAELLSGTPFERAPVVRASVVSGQGIEEVREAISGALQRITQRFDDKIFRLPIDRVFHKTGFGVVVTGSVLSGEIERGRVVEILPEKHTARIRSLQSHDREVTHVYPGFRAALNLAGISPEGLYRGQMATLPGFYQPVYLINGRLTVLADAPAIIKNQMRLRVHLHTTEIFARVIIPESKTLQPGESGYIQLRLEKPLYASYGDRFIIRRYSPQITLGGGVVLETNPPKYRKKTHHQFIQTLEGLESDEPVERIQAAFSVVELKPRSLQDLQVKCRITADEIKGMIEKLLQDKLMFQVIHGKEVLYYHRRQLEKILQEIQRVLGDYHRRFPGRPGLKLRELHGQLVNRFEEKAVELAVSLGLESGQLSQAGEVIALPEFESRLSDSQQKRLNQLQNQFRSAGFNPPTHKEVREYLQISEKEYRELLNILRDQEKLTWVDERLFFHVTVIRQVIDRVRDYFNKHSELSVPQFKDLTGTTRKHAIPLLTYLDNRGITVRKGDVRMAGPNLNKN